MSDYKRATMDQARAAMSFRAPEDTVELRLLLEIRERLDAGRGAGDCACPYCEVVHKAGEDMHGKPDAHAKVEGLSRFVSSLRRTEDELADLDQQIRALAKRFNCAHIGGTTTDILGGIERARTQWGWDNEAEIAAKYHAPAPAERSRPGDNWPRLLNELAGWFPDILIGTDLDDVIRAAIAMAKERRSEPTETQVPEPQLHCLVVRASGAKMEPDLEGVWMRESHLEPYVQARIAEALDLKREEIRGHYHALLNAVRELVAVHPDGIAGPIIDVLGYITQREILRKATPDPLAQVVDSNGERIELEDRVRMGRRINGGVITSIVLYGVGPPDVTVRFDTSDSRLGELRPAGCLTKVTE